MEAILKVISFFIALFVIANGVYTVYMPPVGDEPAGLAIVAVGIFIFVIVMWVSRIQDQERRT
jgi:ABC-type Mn2+/Zn2+ transport system permease subunit